VFKSKIEQPTFYVMHKS